MSSVKIYSSKIKGPFSHMCVKDYFFFTLLTAFAQYISMNNKWMLNDCVKFKMSLSPFFAIRILRLFNETKNICNLTSSLSFVNSIFSHHNSENLE